LPFGLYARRVTNVTHYTEGSDGSVTLAATSIATEWSEPVRWWSFAPREVQRLSRRAVTPAKPSPGRNLNELLATTFEVLTLLAAVS